MFQVSHQFSLLLLVVVLFLLAAQTTSYASTSSSSYSSSSSPHYEKPPCQNDDEKAVQIMGIDGMFCSPSCSDNTSCPSDTPDGVTAIPSCALQSPTGDKYCAILCQPTTTTETETTTANGVQVGGGECGPMTCQPVPQAQGMGICTYSSTSTTTTNMDDLDDMLLDDGLFLSLSLDDYYGSLDDEESSLA
jgi:hypothetical protein